MKEGGGGGLLGLNALHTKLTVNPSVVVDVSFPPLGGAIRRNTSHVFLMSLVTRGCNPPTFGFSSSFFFSGLSNYGTEVKKNNQDLKT